MKKVLSIALILVLLFSFSSVFATENVVENVTDESETIDSTNLVLTNIQDTVEDLVNTILVDTVAPTIEESVEKTTDIISDSIEDAIETTGAEITSTAIGGEYIKGNKVYTEESLSLKNTSFDGNLVIFAQEVDLDDISVDGDVAIFAEDIKISNMTVKNGATVLAAQDLKLDSFTTAGNIYAAAEDMKITASAKSLFAAAQDVQVTDGSDIAKVYDLAQMAKDAEENDDTDVAVAVDDYDWQDKVMSLVGVIVKTAIIAGFILLFTPEFVARTRSENVAKYIGVSALKGAGWVIIIPVLSVVLLITRVAAGVGITLFIMYFILFWSSVPFVAIAIMNSMVKPEDPRTKKFGITVFMALIIAILKLVPILGGIVAVIVTFAGLGIVIGSLGKKCDCKKECKCEAKPEVESSVPEPVKEETIEEVKEDVIEEAKEPETTEEEKED